MSLKIILASASPRRQELLRQVGLAPEVLPSRADESGVSGTPEEIVKELSLRKASETAKRLEPERLTDEIRRKADNAPEAEILPDTERPAGDAPAAGSLRKSFRESPAPGGLKRSEKSGAGLGQDETVLLAADTVVAVENRILGKPRSAEEAVCMIELFQGRSHHVYTGVTLIFLSSGERVTFSEVTEVTVYSMTRDQIKRYVDTGEPMDKAGAYGIQGRFAAYVKEIHGDYNNVVGLPVARVCQELRIRGLL